MCGGLLSARRKQLPAWSPALTLTLTLTPGLSASPWVPSSLVPLQSHSSQHLNPLLVPLLLLFPQLYVK